MWALWVGCGGAPDDAGSTAAEGGTGGSTTEPVATDCLVDEVLTVEAGVGRESDYVPVGEGDPIVVFDQGTLGPVFQVSLLVSNAHREAQTTVLAHDAASGALLGGAGEDGTVRFPLTETDDPCVGALWDLTVTLDDGPIVDMDTACDLLDLPMDVEIGVLDVVDFSQGTLALALILAINPTDEDEDHVKDDCDVCVALYDPEQLETDGDGVGDACDQCPGKDDRIDTDGNLIPDCVE